MSTPTPPEGYRIIPSEYLKQNPLPMDAIYILGDPRDIWEPSEQHGKIPSAQSLSLGFFATAQPLPCFKPQPDFRKLCEELVKAVEADATDDSVAAGLGVGEWESFVRKKTHPVFTRAKAALEESK